MVAPNLVVGSSVGRPDVDVLEPVILDAEGDADESPRPLAGTLRRAPRDLDVDRAVVERISFQHGVRFTVADGSVLDDLDRLLALVVDRFQLDAMRRQLIERLGR